MESNEKTQLLQEIGKKIQKIMLADGIVISDQEIKTLKRGDLVADTNFNLCGVEFTFKPAKKGVCHA